MAKSKKTEGGFDLAAELAKSGVSKLDTGADGREQIEYIDLAKIYPDPNNFYELSGIEELAGNIELVGLQQPIRLRPDPEAEGRYIISSGHRRHAALKRLAKSDAERWAKVPCIVERGAEKESPAMAELKLIFANSSTRELTSAELDRQAERVEALLYQLKEEGVTFPGRMRDQVAQACKVSASKLARLKVIRDKLVAPKFVEAWKSGELKEDPAYVLAQMPALMQEALAKHTRNLPAADILRKIQARGMEHYLATTAVCKSGEGCTNGENFLRHDLYAAWWNIGKCKCCVKCPEVTSCKFACPAGKAAAEKRKAKLKAEQDKQNAKAEKARAIERETRLTFVGGIAKRVLAACEGDKKVFNTVREELRAKESVDCDYSLVNAINAISERKPLDDKGGYLGYHLFSPRWLAAFCRQVGVSADYILGLSDEPLIQAVEERSDGDGVG